MSVAGSPSVGPLGQPLLKADSYTVTFTDLLVETYLLLTVGGKTLTFPTPSEGLLNCELVVGDRSGSEQTLSCTGGFVNGNTVTLPAYGHVVVRCVQTAASTYKWITMGGTAVTLSLTTEQIQDLVAPFLNANLLGITGAYDDAGNATSLTNDVAKYVFTSLTGGTAVDLDSVDGDDLTDGDRAIVVDGNNPGTVYYYVLDADNAGVESSPTIISPDTNAGTKRWVLADMAPAMQTYGDSTTLLTAVQAAIAAGTQTNCTLAAVPGSPGAINLDVNIPGQLTTDQEAAIDGAATPSGANVFMTTSAVAATFASDPLGTAVAALAAKAVPIDADSILLVDSADTNNAKETTVAELRTALLAADPLGSVIAGLAAKATPIDADSIIVCDSADTNDAKETTIAELKAVMLSANNVGGAIAGYAAKVSPIDADSIAICDSADTNDAKETTIAELRAAILAADPLGTVVSALAAKATPVDADTVLLSDSADTNDAKKVTWAQVKATLGITDAIITAIAGSTNYQDWAPTVASVPAVDSTVARYQRIGHAVSGFIDIRGSDGDAWTPSTITLPVAPVDQNCRIPCTAYQKVGAGAKTNMLAEIDAETGASLYIKFNGAAECTDAASWQVQVHFGPYEV